MPSLDANGCLHFDIAKTTLIELIEHRCHHGFSNIKNLGGVSSICEKLHTSAHEGITGITSDVEHRRHVFGTNWIRPKLHNSFLKLAWQAMHDLTLIFLFFIVLISIILSFIEDGSDDWINGVSILVSIMVVILATALNDYVKERQFFSLRYRIERKHMFSVIRNGEARRILVSDIVVGDICQIKYGDMLPADGIIIHSNDLLVDESPLTGQSCHVKKGPTVDGFVLAGTYVLEGRGKIVVMAVGVNTQAAQVFARPHKGVHFTPYKDEKDNNDYHLERSIIQTKLARLAHFCILVGVSIALLTTTTLLVQFVLNHFVKESQPWKSAYVIHILSYIITGVGIMVIACPESLPLAITFCLAYSAKHMMRDNNLLRHLDACETMAYTTTICSNKTSTMTAYEMTVVQSYICGQFYSDTPEFSAIPPHVATKIVEAISINSAYTSRLQPVTITEEAKTFGNRTDCALLQFVQEMGKSYRTVRTEFPEEIFKRVYTFNSYRKSMSTIVPIVGGYRLFCKGASEMILTRCSFIYGQEGALELLTQETEESLRQNVITPMACKGLRTMLVAYRDFVFEDNAINEVLIDQEPDWEDEENIVSNLTCLCMVAIEDPVRPEVPAAIQQCKTAGITVRMITGDNINMARTIATECGIISPDDDFLILDSKEFNKRIRDGNGDVQQHLLDNVWPKLRVLGRASPDDKYTLVKGIIESKLSSNREVVAVIGYSANDGPALKKADVGFALGMYGTDVAKEASDIILTDDYFNSIVKAVIWGRNVYDSIAKFLQFQITVNVVAILSTIFCTIFFQKSPIRTFQILYVSIIMDTLASIALTSEKPTPKLLLHRPYRSTRPLISHTMMRNILGHIVYQLTVILVLVFVGDRLLDVEHFLKSDSSAHRSVIFNTFVLMTLFNELNARKVHGDGNVFEGVLSNPVFCTIWLATWLVQVLFVQYDPISLSTNRLTFEQWLWCLLFGVGTLVWGQLLNALPKSALPRLFAIGGGSPKRAGRYIWLRNVTRRRSKLRRRSLLRVLAKRHHLI